MTGWIVALVATVLWLLSVRKLRRLLQQSQALTATSIAGWRRANREWETAIRELADARRAQTQAELALTHERVVTQTLADRLRSRQAVWVEPASQQMH